MQRYSLDQTEANSPNSFRLVESPVIHVHTILKARYRTSNDSGYIRDFKSFQNLHPELQSRGAFHTTILSLKLFIFPDGTRPLTPAGKY